MLVYRSVLHQRFIVSKCSDCFLKKETQKDIREVSDVFIWRKVVPMVVFGGRISYSGLLCQDRFSGLIFSWGISAHASRKWSVENCHFPDNGWKRMWSLLLKWTVVGIHTSKIYTNCHKLMFQLIIWLAGKWNMNESMYGSYWTLEMFRCQPCLPESSHDI